MNPILRFGVLHTRIEKYMAAHFFPSSFRCFAGAFLLTIGMVGKGLPPAAHAQGAPAPAEAIPLDVPSGGGTFYVEMSADIPARLGSRTIRHDVLVDGERAAFEPKSHPEFASRDWNDGYVPYYTVEEREPASSGEGEVAAELLRLVPVRAPSGEEEVTVRPAPGHEVRSAELHPAIESVSADVEFSGEGRAVYFAGSDPEATVTIEGPAGETLSGRVVVQHLRLADFHDDTKQWQQGLRVVEVAKPHVEPISAELGGDGTAQVSVPIPDGKNRHVGISVVLEDGQRRWAKHLGSAAVVPRRDTGSYHEDGFFISHYSEDLEVLDAYKKMGIDWVRGGLSWNTFEPEPGQYDWSRTDAFYEKLRDAKIYAIQMTHVAPDWARPDTAGLRPFEYKSGMRKRDAAPAREHLDDWQDAYEDFFRRYQDVARAANVWNEPWEGRGITGWASDGAYYRKLFRGVYRAVQKVDSTIKMVAADSGHNTDWKLFSAGMQDQLDVISTHYSSSKTDYAFSMANHYDDMEIWETETWRSWIGDAPSARRVLHYLANGGTKVSLFNEVMLFDHRGGPTPAVVWTGAMRQMLGGQSFEKVVHPERPPFVLLFSGDDGRQVAVVSTTLAEYPGKPGSFRQQFGSERIEMHLPDDADDYQVYDLLGNPVETRPGASVELTVGPEPQYIEFEGSAEAFARRLRNARYESLKPAQIIPYDLTGHPRSGEAELPVVLKNTSPGPQTVTVEVEAEDLVFEDNPREVQLPPAGEKKRLTFAVTAAEEQPANEYPTDITVTPEGGGPTATLNEAVHAATIARGTPTVDGRIGDWDEIGAVPVRMAEGTETGEEEQMMKRPWKEVTANDESFAARMAYAADADNLYVMAEVQDTTRQGAPSLLSGKNLHEKQNPPADYIYIEKGPQPAGDGDLVHLALGGLGQDPFLPKYELRPPSHPLHQFGSYLSTPYKYLLYPTEDGGAEVFRIRTPDFYYLHPLPVDYGWLSEHSRVEGAEVRVRRTDGGYVYEAALPWSELKGVPHAPGDRLRMSMAVQDGGMGNRLTWSQDRAAASLTRLDFEPGYGDKWSSETQWTFRGEK